MPAAELAGLRDEANKVLDKTATVRRPAEGVDSTGAPTLTYADHHAEPCRVDPGGLSSAERTEGDRIVALVQYDIVFRALADVQSKDRVVVDGRTFEVVGGGRRSDEVLMQVAAFEIL